LTKRAACHSASIPRRSPGKSSGHAPHSRPSPLGKRPDSDPLYDLTLWTKLDFAINGDGTIEGISVFRSSGNAEFDAAALAAVLQGEPYPEPPAQVLSGDGRLHLRWSLHRDHSQCGSWNAEPFILPDPREPAQQRDPGQAPSP